MTLEKILKHNAKLDFVNHTPQPKASASQPKSPADAICHKCTPAWPSADPCTDLGF